MKTIDFALPAELYASQGRSTSRRPVTYRRFTDTALAIQFAMESLPAGMLPGTVVETGDDRLEAADIRQLYESEGYPLNRRPTE